MTKEHKKKLSISKLDQKNPNWKGKLVKKPALHIWVTRRFPKPSLCQFCKKSKPLDLANISQRYKRNLTDWEWLCRKCHMIKDGRLSNFLNRKRLLIPPRICRICGKKKKHKAHGLCLKCFEKLRYYKFRRNTQTVKKLKNLSHANAIKKLLS